MTEQLITMTEAELVEVKRRAFAEGWNDALQRAKDYGLLMLPDTLYPIKMGEPTEYAIAGVGASEAARKKYAFTPRSVTCALCGRDGADIGTGLHLTRDECIEALGKAFAASVEAK